MKKIIVGKNSFIAKKLSERGEYITTERDINSTKSIFLDLQNAEIFDYSVLNDDTIVVFLAAISSPDECKKNYSLAYKVNVLGTKYFIHKAIKQKAKVLFFSSDVVYGNTLKNVDENSLTNPFGEYAKMKNEIEKEFEGEKNFKIFRLSYVLSKEDKYLSYLRECYQKGEKAEVFHPFSRKIIYLEDVLEAIEEIIIRWNEFDNQKFNICGQEQISRKDIADFYNELISNRLEYTLVEPNKYFWQARPKIINITSLYFEKLLGKKPTKIQDAIKKIIKEGE